MEKVNSKSMDYTPFKNNWTHLRNCGSTNISISKASFFEIVNPKGNCVLKNVLEF